MVGKKKGSILRIKISSRINAVKYGGSGDIASKLDQLRRLREELSGADSVLLVEFLSPLLDLLSDSSSPVGNPSLKFIMEILSRLVSKQIWKYPKLWVGFMKCALLTKPQSFGVLLQLPPAQLENALNRTPALRSPLVAHANQPHIRSSLPRSSLVVLGIASDAQTSNQPKPTQSPTGENGNSDKGAVTE